MPKAKPATKPSGKAPSRVWCSWRRTSAGRRSDEKAAGMARPAKCAKRPNASRSENRGMLKFEQQLATNFWNATDFPIDSYVKKNKVRGQFLHLAVNFLPTPGQLYLQSTFPSRPRPMAVAGLLDRCRVEAQLPYHGANLLQRQGGPHGIFKHLPLMVIRIRSVSIDQVFDGGIVSRTQQVTDEEDTAAAGDADHLPQHALRFGNVMDNAVGHDR